MIARRQTKILNSLAKFNAKVEFFTGKKNSFTRVEIILDFLKRAAILPILALFFLQNHH
jgi:hypothetical protein